ncbi:MAG: sigma-70 family RNA polymerase sigma factor [Sphingobacteriales bacterium]|nr:MAG: sigma-70 family RNA polymerase sigma factor [Sphingobacteriales bacterium]
MTEQQIISDCKKRQAKAQKLLYDRYAQKMMLVCLRYVKNQADAEELMLNGFYKFFDQIERFVYNGEGSIAPWLKKIMVNECLMFLRKKGRLIMIDEKAAEEIPADDSFFSGMEAARLFGYITELPHGCRTVFNLFVVEQYTHKEVAILLGISEGTSKSQLSKARQLLQHKIKQEGGYHEQFR